MKLLTDENFWNGLILFVVLFFGLGYFPAPAGAGQAPCAAQEQAAAPAK